MQILLNVYISVILNECLSQDDEAATAADDKDDADDDDDVIADTNNDAMLMNCFSAIVDTLAKTNPRFVSKYRFSFLHVHASNDIHNYVQVHVATK